MLFRSDRAQIRAMSVAPTRIRILRDLYMSLWCKGAATRLVNKRELHVLPDLHL